jgi:hypothetical protein
MSEFYERRAIGPADRRTREGIPRSRETDALFHEEPTMIREDEAEVYDLGFIVEDREDRRGGLLEHWQRLETLDTDEAMETDPRGALPEEARVLSRIGVPAAWHPAELSVEHADAEGSEQEFAESTGLLVDPAAHSPKSAARRGGCAVPVRDRDQGPGVGLHGYACGIATGFGTSIPQDIGVGGFAVGDNPVLVLVTNKKP